jgi:hypothetical protein
MRLLRRNAAGKPGKNYLKRFDMRLQIEAHKMVIITESVQDVSYLKHLGYLNSDSDIYLKISVFQTFEGFEERKEGAEIELKWEHKDAASCDNMDSSKKYQCVQHIEGGIKHGL